MNTFNEEDLISVFEDFPVSDNSTLKFIRDKNCAHEVLQAYKAIIRDSLFVLERQLCDFLHDGIFGGELANDVKKKS